MDQRADLHRWHGADERVDVFGTDDAQAPEHVALLPPLAPDAMPKQALLQDGVASFEGPRPAWLKEEREQVPETLCSDAPVAAPALSSWGDAPLAPALPSLARGTFDGPSPAWVDVPAAHTLPTRRTSLADASEPPVALAATPTPGPYAARFLRAEEPSPSLRRTSAAPEHTKGGAVRTALGAKPASAPRPLSHAWTPGDKLAPPRAEDVDASPVPRRWQLEGRTDENGVLPPGSAERALPRRAERTAVRALR